MAKATAKTSKKNPVAATAMAGKRKNGSVKTTKFMGKSRTKAK